MFGDVLSNNRGWETGKMEEVAPIKPYQGVVESDGDKYWLLNLDMVESQTGRIIGKNMVFSSEIGTSTIAFGVGNVLYSKLRPYLNKVVIPEESGYATTELLPLCPKENLLNTVFLTELLRGNEFVQYIQDKVAGTKMPRVQMDVFRNFQVILPPLDIQHRFADFVRQADKSKFSALKLVKYTALLCYNEDNTIGGNGYVF